jgi:hypothetical protein
MEPEVDVLGSFFTPIETRRDEEEDDPLVSDEHFRVVRNSQGLVGIQVCTHQTTVVLLLNNQLRTLGIHVTLQARSKYSRPCRPSIGLHLRITPLSICITQWVQEGNGQVCLNK